MANGRGKGFAFGAVVTIGVGLVTPSIQQRRLVLPAFDRNTLINLGILAITGGVVGFIGSMIFRGN